MHPISLKLFSNEGIFEFSTEFPSIDIHGISHSVHIQHVTTIIILGLQSAT